MAGHVEGNGVGVPGRAQIADRPGVDHQRRELVLGGGRRRRGDGRRQQQVALGEQLLHRAVGQRAVCQGLAQGRDIDRLAFFERLGERRVEIAAARLQQLAKALDLVGAQDQAGDIEFPVDLAAVDLADARALLVEEGDGGVEPRFGIGIEIAAGHAADDGDAPAGDGIRAGGRRPGKRRAADRGGPRVVAMAARHGGEAGTEIGGMARHDAEVGELAELVGRRLVGHAAERGLQPIDAAAGGRNATRPGTVGGHGDRPEAERDRHCRTAARAAAAVLAIPRIARDAVQAAVGQDLVAELRRRRLGEQHGVGRPPLGDGIGIDRRHIVLHRQRREGGAQAAGQDQVLGRDRHGGQCPEAVAALAAAIERIGGGAGTVGIERGDGIVGLGPGAARQQTFDDVARGDTAGGEGLHDSGDGPAGEILCGQVTIPFLIAGNMQRGSATRQFIRPGISFPRVMVGNPAVARWAAESHDARKLSRSPPMA